MKTNNRSKNTKKRQEGKLGQKRRKVDKFFEDEAEEGNDSDDGHGHGKGSNVRGI